LTTYDWIKSFLEITIEGRAIYGNLENKIRSQTVGKPNDLKVFGTIKPKDLNMIATDA
jgi:hypothetical protein